MGEIIIAIVNWNTGSLLAQCLTSLLRLPESERRLIDSIVVIDNASSDDSAAQAKGVVTDAVPVQFVEQRENLGFARGNNIVLSRDNDSHIFLLNPDTKVMPGAIQELLGCLERNPKAGIVGPKLLNADGSLQPSVRALPTWAVLLFYLFKLNRLMPNSGLWKRYLMRDFDYEVEQGVPQVMGAAFLIRSEAAQQLGGLDEKFWLWFEEVDYCKRAQEAGWKVIYTPAAEIVHFGGVSFGQWGSWQRYFQFMRSALRYARKHLT